MLMLIYHSHICGMQKLLVCDDQAKSHALRGPCLILLCLTSPAHCLLSYFVFPVVCALVSQVPGTLSDLMIFCNIFLITLLTFDNINSVTKNTQET